jgi:hypothetical protein
LLESLVGWLFDIEPFDMDPFDMDPAVACFFMGFLAFAGAAI